MEDQQQHVEDDYCASSCSLFDILQAAPRLAKLLPSEGCKTLAASCTRMRTWHRTRVTVIRLTDPKEMTLLQPQLWLGLVTVMLDSTGDHRVSVYDMTYVKESLPATWTQLASVCLGAQCSDEEEAPICTSPPIDSFAVLLQPAGLQMLQQQDKRPHVCTLKNWIRRAAPYVTDIFITGHLGAHITQMFAQHRWLCLEIVSTLGPSTLDADMVFHLGHFLPQCTYTLQCAHCNFTTTACSSVSDIYWSGLCVLNLSDCSLDAAAMHCLSKAVWSNLAMLDLSQNTLGGLAVKHLVSARWLSLTSLDLRGTGLDAAAFKFLSAGNWPSLSGLYLQDNHIDIQGIQVLMQGAWPELQYLGLTHNMLDEGVYALLEVRCWQQQCAGVDVSDVKPPYRRSCAQAKDIAMSRSTKTTWPSLTTVNVSFDIT